MVTWAHCQGSWTWGLEPRHFNLQLGGIRKKGSQGLGGLAFHLSLSLFFVSKIWKIVFPHSLAEDRRAANTQNYCLRMAKNGGDCIASWAFHIHKIGTRRFFLCFLFWRRMKEILGERHVLMGRSSQPERVSSLFCHKPLLSLRH